MSLPTPFIPPGGVVPEGGIPRPQPEVHATAESPPIIYLIRHGEKNTTDAEGSLIGLNKDGQDRANALPEVFNYDNSNPFNIRYMLAMRPDEEGGGERPWQTVMPLAISLQQTILQQATLQNPPIDFFLIDNTIYRDDVVGAAKQMTDFIATRGTGNILVCWEHKHLKPILEAFGFKNPLKYPGMFDVVWTLKPQPVKGDHKTYTYNVIEWSSERTAADVESADDGSNWMKTAGISSLTTESEDGGPSIKWGGTKKPKFPSFDDSD